MTTKTLYALSVTASLPLVLGADDPIATLLWLVLAGYTAWLWLDAAAEDAR